MTEQQEKRQSGFSYNKAFWILFSVLVTASFSWGALVMNRLAHVEDKLDASIEKVNNKIDEKVAPVYPLQADISEVKRDIQWIREKLQSNSDLNYNGPTASRDIP